MFCPEDRIPREIFWAGFGFQVWCQMLTHVIQSSDKALFLIDEPDIYLHSDRSKRAGISLTYTTDAANFLHEFSDRKKSYVTAQYLACRRQFERKNSSGLHEATITEATLEEFEECWREPAVRLKAIPGKEALSAFNQHLQDSYGVSVTPTAIVDAMEVDQIPDDIRLLIENIASFASS